MHAKEFKRDDPLHCVTVDGNGGMYSFLSSEVYYQLLSLGNTEGEIVFLASLCQDMQSFAVGDKANHCCVISKFHDNVGTVSCDTIICVDGVYERAQHASLWSTSVNCEL